MKVRTLAEMEQSAIYHRLFVCDYNVTRTAKSLGIAVRTLQRKLAGYGLYKAAQGMPASVRRGIIKQFIEKEMEGERR